MIFRAVSFVGPFKLFAWSRLIEKPSPANLTCWFPRYELIQELKITRNPVSSESFDHPVREQVDVSASALQRARAALSRNPASGARHDLGFVHILP